MRIYLKKNKVTKDELLKKFGLNKDNKAVNVITLKEAIKRIDPALSDHQANSVSIYIMKEREYVSAIEILEDLGYEDTGLETDDIDP